MITHLCELLNPCADGLQAVARNSRGLRRLDVSGCSWVTTHCVREVVHSCPVLERVTATNCASLSRSIDDDNWAQVIAAAAARGSLRLDTGDGGAVVGAASVCDDGVTPPPL